MRRSPVWVREKPTRPPMQSPHAALRPLPVIATLYPAPPEESAKIKRQNPPNKRIEQTRFARSSSAGR